MKNFRGANTFPIMAIFVKAHFVQLMKYFLKIFKCDKDVCLNNILLNAVFIQIPDIAFYTANYVPDHV